jgi:hypothetical protein
MRADSPFKLRCLGLDPSEDRRVVDLDAAIEQHEFQIAVADGKHQIPSHGPKDRIGCELAPLEAITQTNSDARPIVPPQSYGKSASSKVCNRSPGGVGGVASRGVPLSRSWSESAPTGKASGRPECVPKSSFYCPRSTLHCPIRTLALSLKFVRKRQMEFAPISCYQARLVRVFTSFR